MFSTNYINRLDKALNKIKEGGNEFEDIANGLQTTIQENKQKIVELSAQNNELAQAESQALKIKNLINKNLLGEE